MSGFPGEGNRGLRSSGGAHATHEWYRPGQQGAAETQPRRASARRSRRAAAAEGARVSAGLVVDLFAGGGGASTGIEAALEEPVDIAINHDRVALDVHRANHPRTTHLTKDVWKARPLEVTGGRPVRLMWASPDCTHHSVAKGGKPLKKNIRALAWVVVRWAQDVGPAVIFLENVAEFRTWCPLDRAGRPIKRRKGETFRRWVRHLERLGYVVEFRVLDASLYGAPTRRRRLFLVARRDGLPVVWPEPTHGPGRLLLRTAAGCIDWSIPCPSIFERKRPLAEKTLWRIAQGLRRFVFESPRPFIVQYHNERGGAAARLSKLEEPLGTQTTENRFGLVAPSLVKVNHGEREARGEPVSEPISTITATQRGHALVTPTLIQTGYGERDGQAARVPGLLKPLGTMVNGQKHALVAAWLAKHFGGVVGQEVPVPASTITAKDHHGLCAATLVKFRGNEENGHPGCAPVDEPMPTVTAGGFHVAEVRAFLTAYYGDDGTTGQSVLEPLRTITSKHRLGLVTIEGTEYQIVDIGLRMLEPHELARAQFGRFAEQYDLSAARTKSKKVQLIGDSVCPEVAEALVRANVQRRERVA